MNFFATISNLQIIYIVPEVAATVNISARSIASSDMQKAFLVYANYEFHNTHSVIIDVGTVPKFYTLEEILTLPMFLDPIPYRSIPAII